VSGEKAVLIHLVHVLDEVMHGRVNAEVTRGGIHLLHVDKFGSAKQVDVV
jgi:hypothetical protein